MVPYFEKRGSFLDMDLEVFNDLNYYNTKSLQEVEAPPLSYLTPDGT